jgi:hypothetical protein
MVRFAHLDEMYDDDYDEYDDDYEEDMEVEENDEEHVAYDPTIHKPELLQAKIDQVKQIVPRSDHDIRRALQEKGSVERAIDFLLRNDRLMLEGNDIIVYLEEEAKGSFVLPVCTKFVPLGSRKFNPLSRTTMDMTKVKRLIDQVQIVEHPLQLAVPSKPIISQQVSPRPMSLASLASANKTPNLSLSSLQKKDGRVSKSMALKNGLSSLNLRANSSSTPKPSFSLSQLKNSEPVVTKTEKQTASDSGMKDSDTRKSTLASADPSNHGLFLTTSDIPFSSPILSFSLTPFLDNEPAFSAPSPNMMAQQARQKPSSMR